MSQTKHTVKIDDEFKHELDYCCDEDEADASTIYNLNYDLVDAKI